MSVKQKLSGRALSIPMGLAIGSVVSIAVTLVASGLVAFLIYRETMDIQWVGYASMAVLSISSILGAAVSAKCVGKMRLQICLANGGIYYLMLLGLNLVFFGGVFTGMLVTAMVIVFGSLVPCIPGISIKSRKHFRPQKKAYR